MAEDSTHCQPTVGKERRHIKRKHTRTEPMLLQSRVKKASSCGVPGIVFVVFGGIDSNGSSLSDTWIYLIQKSQWLLLSGNVLQLVEHRTPWSTNISWCHLDALYVVGHGAGDVEEIWKFSLRTLKWSNESLYLTEQPRCNYTLPIAPHPTTDSISLLWNGTFYLY